MDCRAAEPQCTRQAVQALEIPKKCMQVVLLHPWKAHTVEALPTCQTHCSTVYDS